MKIPPNQADIGRPDGTSLPLAPPTRIAFITTCKGRLQHLQQSLPTWVAENPAEIIVVDYACPQHAGDWVAQHHPAVKVVRVNDDPGFCAARARNAGAHIAQSPWLCFIDADVKVNTGWLAWAGKYLDHRFLFRAGPAGKHRVRETFGTFLCPRGAFEKATGYDEVFHGWGGEDIDLYRRLGHTCGLAQANYPARFVEPITHADDQRLAFYNSKDMLEHKLISWLYLEAKSLYMKNTDLANQPALHERQALMQRVRERIEQWAVNKSQPVQPISFGFDSSRLLGGEIRVRLRGNFTLTVENATLLALGQAEINSVR